jgi:competence protein ComEC
VRTDPVLVVASALVLGGFCASTPLPVAVGALFVAVLLAGRTPRTALAVALVASISTAVRAHAAVAAYERSLESARVALGAPRRCSGVARVVASPTERAGSLSFVADFESLDCEGEPVAGFRARLYGASVDLARGDRVEVVAQLAPAELFHNAELGDPAPAAARAGVLASGAALDVRVVEPGRSLF